MNESRWLLPLVVALSAACSEADENQDADGAVLLLEDVRAQNYREWLRPPGWETRTPSNAAKGAAVDIYVNSSVALALESQALLAAWPEGSTIVKDGFNGDALRLIAIMDKRQDGWYWAEFDASGEPAYSGRPATCTNCHARGSDFVRAFRLP